jgi:hypothetical protein
MSWNHRVVKRTFNEGGYTEDRYAIHEAYYDENGKVWGITEEPVEPHGETMDELKKDIDWMTQCLEHPILDYDQIPEEGAISPIPPSERRDECET